MALYNYTIYMIYTAKSKMEGGKQTSQDKYIFKTLLPEKPAL